MKFKSSLAILLLLVPLTAFSQSYDEIKKVLSDNCSDCYGGRKTDLEAAVKNLQTMVDSGEIKSSEAITALAEAYNTLAYVYYDENTVMKESLKKKSKEAYLVLGGEVYGQILSGEASSESSNFELAYNYALNLTGVNQITSLENLHNLNMNNSIVKYSLGQALYYEGQENLGIKYMSDSIMISEGDQAYYQGIELVSILVEKGLTVEAENVIEVMRNKSLSQDIDAIYKKIIVPAIKREKKESVILTSEKILHNESVKPSKPKLMTEVPITPESITHYPEDVNQGEHKLLVIISFVLLGLIGLVLGLTRLRK
jgi:hypothetical protein